MKCLPSGWSGRSVDDLLDLPQDGDLHVLQLLVLCGGICDTRPVRGLGLLSLRRTQEHNLLNHWTSVPAKLFLQWHMRDAECDLVAGLFLQPFLLVYGFGGRTAALLLGPVRRRPGLVVLLAAGHVDLLGPAKVGLTLYLCSNTQHPLQTCAANVSYGSVCEDTSWLEI